MMKQILFQIDRGIYGIDVSSVMGIEKNMDVISVPNSPHCIEGIINLRGEVIPVFNLREKFKLDPNFVLETTEFIIARVNDMNIAFKVDAVKEIAEIDDSQINTVPKIIKSEQTEYIKSVTQIGNDLVLEINLGGILDETQRKQLELILED